MPEDCGDCVEEVRSADFSFFHTCSLYQYALISRTSWANDQLLDHGTVPLDSDIFTVPNLSNYKFSVNLSFVLAELVALLLYFRSVGSLHSSGLSGGRRIPVDRCILPAQWLASSLPIYLVHSRFRYIELGDKCTFPGTLQNVYCSHVKYREKVTTVVDCSRPSASI